MASNPLPAKGSKRLTGAALTAFIALVVAATSSTLTESNEGYSGKAYWDRYGKVWTQCFGETAGVRPDLIYSKTECAVKLRARMAKDFAPVIVRCVPDFADPAHKWAFGASIDASYNAGPAAFCKSRMAKAFNAGQWLDGCRSFVGWYETAGGVKLAGLVRRRREEMTYCMTGRKA